MVPLATWASAEMAKFFQKLPQRTRGVHPNSAFDVSDVDYVDLSKDDAATAIVDTAKRFTRATRTAIRKGAGRIGFPLAVSHRSRAHGAVCHVRCSSHGWPFCQR
jgi:hypothetical protein